MQTATIFGGDGGTENMLQLLYFLAFTVLTTLVISNLIRNLFMFGREAQRPPNSRASHRSDRRRVPHPELIDDHGNIIDEPLLVMRSITVDDAREQLDALYNQSPESTDEASGRP
ncbi:MAG: DUF2973 domain-containing protein [Thermosynechococcaceae cyanobacterium]